MKIAERPEGNRATNTVLVSKKIEQFFYKNFHGIYHLLASLFSSPVYQGILRCTFCTHHKINFKMLDKVGRLDDRPARLRLPSSWLPPKWYPWISTSDSRYDILLLLLITVLIKKNGTTSFWWELWMNVHIMMPVSFFSIYDPRALPSLLNFPDSCCAADGNDNVKIKSG